MMNRLLTKSGWRSDAGRNLLAIWLIATGLFSLLPISLPLIPVLLHVLAMAAGILLLLGT